MPWLSVTSAAKPSMPPPFLPRCGGTLARPFQRDNHSSRRVRYGVLDRLVARLIDGAVVSVFSFHLRSSHERLFATTFFERVQRGAGFSF